ncbi:MAG: hypothetical protein ABI402_06205 [Ferruginibacter sp.]
MVEISRDVNWVDVNSKKQKSSKVPSNITEAAIRNLALAKGLVDVKVCAVDEVWSG